MFAARNTLFNVISGGGDVIPSNNWDWGAPHYNSWTVGAEVQTSEVTVTGIDTTISLKFQILYHDNTSNIVKFYVNNVVQTSLNSIGNSYAYVNVNNNDVVKIGFYNGVYDPNTTYVTLYNHSDNDSVLTAEGDLYVSWGD